MDKKGQNILDKLLGKNQKDDSMKEEEATLLTATTTNFDDFVDEATKKAIQAAHDAIKPFPIPKKMLDNITNKVYPVMKEYLDKAWRVGKHNDMNERYK